MSTLTLTPAAISYLTQIILAVTISGYLSYQWWEHRTRQLTLLAGFFYLATLFIALLFLDASFSPYYRLWAVYAENTVLALALVFLIQFAYHFPQKYPQHKWESRLALGISLAYFAWEAYYMVFRYYSLIVQETVYYRPLFASYSMAFVLAIAPVAFLRQSLAVDTRSVSWVKKLWKPKGEGARGAQIFVLVFMIPVVLGIINVLLTFKLPYATYNISMSIGILVALWLFAINYINFVPGGTGVQVKLSILILTLFLALLGSLGWFIAPPYIATFQPNLTDLQTLRFTPNDRGGYDVAETEFAFENELGEKLSVSVYDQERNHKIEYTFPFYGQTYDEIYVTSSGAITLGEPFWHPNMQAQRVNTPAIFPLMIDLDPNPDLGIGGAMRGVYARLDPVTGRLILTWDHLPALHQPDALFTFQAVLYPDGVFEITYNGLPLPFTFDPDATPSANPWVRGAAPGRGESLHAALSRLPYSRDPGELAILENYQVIFRRYLHKFMRPLAGVVLGGSLALILVLPLLLRYSVIRPLEILTNGVHQMESGDLSVELPTQHNDEIGYLTGAFNAMAARLNNLVTDLESQVAERTSKLADANQGLIAEMKALTEAQDRILEQQRKLAALEERHRIAGDLHDSMTQSLHSLVLSVETAQYLHQESQPEKMKKILEVLEDSARQAVWEMRLLCFELQLSPEESINWFELLETRLASVEGRTGVDTILTIENPDVISRDQQREIFYIMTEALNNALRHSYANHIWITIRGTPHQVVAEVRDDGRGFEADRLKAPGMGLKNIRARAENLAGKLTIDSVPGKGTTINFTMSLERVMK